MLWLMLENIIQPRICEMHGINVNYVIVGCIPFAFGMHYVVFTCIPYEHVVCLLAMWYVCFLKTTEYFNLESLKVRND